MTDDEIKSLIEGMAVKVQERLKAAAEKAEAEGKRLKEEWGVRRLYATFGTIGGGVVGFIAGKIL